VSQLKTTLPENIEWKPFAAFPPSVRLAVMAGQPSEPGPYMIRVKVPGCVKLMPHRHSENRIYTVISGVFYVGAGEEFDADKLERIRPARWLSCPVARLTFTGLSPANTFRRSRRFDPWGLNT